MVNRIPLYFFHLCLCCIFAPRPLHAAPKPAPVPAGTEIVELPVYTVTDVRILQPQESWSYATLPGFEILSNASDKNTRRFIGEFQLARIGIQLVWPDIVTARPTVPSLILLCTGNSFKNFLPQNPGNDSFITPASLFVEDRERGAIIIDFSLNEIFDGRDNTTIIVDPYKEFSRQYTRFLMRRANGNRPLPPWLESGLSQIFSTIDVDKNSADFARLDEGGFRQTAVRSDDPLANPDDTEIDTPYILNASNLDPNMSWLAPNPQARPRDPARSA